MKALTTGQVAKICSVAPRTVSKWFDAGDLKGYKVPGSQDRRIPVDSLRRFMVQHGMPLDGLETETILVVSPTEYKFGDALAGLPMSRVVRWAKTAFDAGVKVATLRPRLVLLDYELGVSVIREIVIPEGVRVATASDLSTGEIEELLLGARQ